ncbi:MAG: serine protease [Reyranella sp.]|nr:serine protease [Reyranella sp.]
MPVVIACFRTLGCAAACCLVLLMHAAMAQPVSTAFHYKWNTSVPSEMITPADLEQALIWTGHISSVGGETSAGKAARAWQASKGYPATASLPDDQAVELVMEGLKRRDSYDWSILRDDAVGFAVGIPAGLVRSSPPRAEDNALWYRADGAISHSVGAYYGSPNCSTMDTLYAKTKAGAVFHARLDMAFVILTRRGGRDTLTKAICLTSGLVTAVVSMPSDRVAVDGVLFTAVANSLVVSRKFDPSTRPRPRTEELPPAPMGVADGEVARSQPTGSVPSTVDSAGMTGRLKLALRDGADLRAEEVFEKAAGAVYKMKVDKRIGSAVAVSESDLLTNCHVVGDRTRVTLVRDGKELTADVVSMNVNADRCVLRTETKLPTWVDVRPYDDIRIGERAITIGTPQGLELTVAEGIVSSKRSQNDSKLIQTSAPISQGSSGGGLFDAQGQLLGITTFYFKAGQNLNFAVAAEEYARPYGQPD